MPDGMLPLPHLQSLIGENKKGRERKTECLCVCVYVCVSVCVREREREREREGGREEGRKRECCHVTRYERALLMMPC